MGQPRDSISQPATQYKDLINWLLEQQMDIPDRKNGIAFIYKVYEKEKKENVLPVTLYIGAANRHAYLDTWSVKVTYNEGAFGMYLLSKGRLDYNILRRDLSASGYYGREFQASEDYTVDLEELGHNSFKITWQKKKDADLYFQVNPIGLKKHLDAIPLIDLHFPVVKETSYASIKITPIGTTSFVDLKTSKSQAFDYQYSSPALNKKVSQYYPAKIMDFYPKQVAIGDTVTIVGEYLLSKRVSLFGKSNKGRGFISPVPKEYVLEQTDDLIRFVVPAVLGKTEWQRQNHDLEEWFWPVTKYFVLSGEYPIKTSTMSEVDLEIVE